LQPPPQSGISGPLSQLGEQHDGDECPDHARRRCCLRSSDECRDGGASSDDRRSSQLQRVRHQHPVASIPVWFEHGLNAKPLIVPVTATCPRDGRLLLAVSGNRRTVDVSIVEGVASKRRIELVTVETLQRTFADPAALAAHALTARIDGDIGTDDGWDAPIEDIDLESGLFG
jgi:hypothetical protein